MLAQLDNHVIEVASFVVALQLGVSGIMFGILKGVKKEIDEHKKDVRFSETCDKIHQGLDKLADERHQEMKKELGKLADLIRNNGQGTPKVQT